MKSSPVSTGRDKLVGEDGSLAPTSLVSLKNSPTTIVSYDKRDN
jgi:hypothetical protein